MSASLLNDNVRTGTGTQPLPLNRSDLAETTGHENEERTRCFWSRQRSELAVTYESPDPYKRWFYGRRFAAVMSALGAQPGDEVLGGGCGSGGRRNCWRCWRL